MKLQTKVNIPYPEVVYDHQSKFTSLGSCFANELGSYLESRLLDCLTNPLGTLFNPLALAETIDRSLENRYFEPSEFFEHLELWRHFLVHSSLASTQKSHSVDAANRGLCELGRQLLGSKLLIITLGTAWAYESTTNRGPIGHNHKLPLEGFRRRLLTQLEIKEALTRLLNQLVAKNPQLRICLTISPVRHLRDGLHENNLSKSTLLLAAHEIVSELPYVSYYPAYEILLDELRDYRFYTNDLSHPTSLAVEYICERFVESYTTNECQNLSQEVAALNADLSHRTHHIDTTDYKKFKSYLRGKIEALEPLGLEISSLLKKFSELP